MFWRSLFSCLFAAASLNAAQPNLVFILVDDMGYGDLGCTGSKDIATPNIDRIAKEGVQMTDFYANAPVCTPTRAGFMHGRWQQAAEAAATVVRTSAQAGGLDVVPGTRP